MNSFAEAMMEMHKQARSAAPAIACPADVDAQTWADWLALRKAKKAPVTDTALTSARREADTAGMALDALVTAADQSLYRAKAVGKNRIEVYS